MSTAPEKYNGALQVTIMQNADKSPIRGLYLEQPLSATLGHAFLICEMKRLNYKLFKSLPALIFKDYMTFIK